MSQHIDPTPEQIEKFKGLAANTPILMLNLINLKERASYEDGRKVTGTQAYQTYGEGTAPLLAGVGGAVVWQGIPETVLIGPQDEHWDIAFIVRYPSANAFFQMITSPEYQQVVIHRRAAVADSRLVRLSQPPE